MGYKKSLISEALVKLSVCTFEYLDPIGLVPVVNEIGRREGDSLLLYLRVQRDKPVGAHSLRQFTLLQDIKKVEYQFLNKFLIILLVLIDISAIVNAELIVGDTCKTICRHLVCCFIY